jgi:hypothetical protein
MALISASASSTMKVVGFHSGKFCPSMSFNMVN